MTSSLIWQDGTGAIAEVFHGSHREVFAEDMVWRIEGHSLASREYATAAEFIDEVLKPFGALFDPTQLFRTFPSRQDPFGSCR